MIQFFRSIRKSIHVLLLCAFALSIGAPVKAMARQRLQGAGESISRGASRAASAMVGGARYSAAWINRQIESGTTNIPLWGYRRIAGLFRRFASPDKQELQVMKKWMNRQPLSEQEQTIWSAYKRRVYSSRGAIAAIATVVIAILAAAAGTVISVQQKRERERAEATRAAAAAAAAAAQFKKSDAVSYKRNYWYVNAVGEDGFLTLRSLDLSRFKYGVDPQLVRPAPFPPGSLVLFDGKLWTVKAVQIDGSLDLTGRGHGQVARAINPSSVTRYKRRSPAPVPSAPAPLTGDPLGASVGLVGDLGRARIPAEDIAAYAARAAAARRAAQEDARRRAEARVKRDLEQEKTIEFFEQFLSPEAAEREAQEAAERAQAAADAGAAVAAATAAIDERARAVAAAEAAARAALGPITVSPLVAPAALATESPAQQAADFLAQAYLSASQLEVAQLAQDEQARREFIERTVNDQIRARQDRLIAELGQLETGRRTGATRRQVQMKEREIAQLQRLSEVASQLLRTGTPISAQAILQGAVQQVRSEAQAAQLARERGETAHRLLAPRGGSQSARDAIEFGAARRAERQAQEAQLLAQ